jgi:putative transposase
VSDAGARREEALSHGHVVECGAVAPLLIRTEKVVFNAGPRTLSLHAAYSPVATRADALLSNRGTYFVTASTYLKTHHFYAPQHLDVLHRGLLGVTRDFSWDLEALAVFSNHYHFVVHSPRASENASSLSQMLALLHARTAKWTNRLDGKPNRKVWHNFWDTKLTYEKSYLARLHSVHQNAVKHGLVPVANQYQWCSARWFEQIASPAMVRSIYRFKIDRLSIRDNFAPIVKP